MTAQAQQLVEQALAFPPDERQQIACALLRSVPAVEPPPYSGEALAKARELSRRYHAGEEQAISGEEFKGHLEKWIEELRAEDQRPGVV